MAVFLQIAIGILSDYDDPTFPFGVTIILYAVIGGLPLAILLITLCKYSKKMGAPAFQWKSSATLQMLAGAIPLSGFLGMGIRLILANLLHSAMPRDSIRNLLLYFLAGGIFYGLFCFLVHKRASRNGAP